MLPDSLYADDAGVVSKSPEQLGKMMDVIVTVCAAFGLTVSEAKTEIMCLRTRGMSDAASTFSVEAAGQVYKQTHYFFEKWEYGCNSERDVPKGLFSNQSQKMKVDELTFPNPCLPQYSLGITHRR